MPQAAFANSNPLDARVRQALALHRRGMLADAEKIYEEILGRQPSHFDALHLLGAIAHQTRRPERSVELLEKAIKLNPESAAAYSNLGLALFDLGRFEEAIARQDRAIAVKPDLAEAYNNRGNALQALQRHAEAIASYGKAIALEPDYADAYNNLGNSLYRVDRSAAAVVQLERAIALAPDHGGAHHHLGVALTALGRLDEGRRAIERAIELMPRRPEFYRALGKCKIFAAGDPYLVAMEQMASDMAPFSPDEQMQLHFALGKALADVGHHARSFDHLLAGNALRRAQIVYREAGVLGVFGRLPRVFTPALMRGKAGQGDPSRVPVFIVGMPRSGTTLIEQILASHPKVFGAGEVDAFQTALFGAENADDISATSAEQLRKIGARYLERITPLAPGAERITDKMPGNFGFVGLIHLALTNARIIHARRDPVDTCLSCFSQLFTTGQLHTYELGELGRYYRAYAALMEHWRAVLPAGVMLEVQYEEVVADIERQARRIVAHCGLGWDEACLSFHKTQRSVGTASAAQVRRPLYSSSVGRWLPYKDRLKPLLDALDGAVPDMPR